MKKMSKIINFPTEEKDIDEFETLSEKQHDIIKKMTQYRGEIPTKEAINCINRKSVKCGSIYWVTSEKTAFIVADITEDKIQLQPLDEGATISTGLTIFDLNKGIVSREPLFNWKDSKTVSELKQNLKEWFNSIVPKNKFFLLYGRNLHYFSVLDFENGTFSDDSFDILKESLEMIGHLISMDFNTVPEQGVEIWIRTRHELAELLYLFPFDAGLIKL